MGGLGLGLVEDWAGVTSECGWRGRPIFFLSGKSHFSPSPDLFISTKLSSFITLRGKVPLLLPGASLLGRVLEPHARGSGGLERLMVDGDGNCDRGGTEEGNRGGPGFEDVGLSGTCGTFCASMCLKHSAILSL